MHVVSVMEEMGWIFENSGTAGETVHPLCLSVTQGVCLRPCLHLVLKCVSVIRTQVDSQDTSPFTPFYHVSPAFVTAYVTRRSKGPAHSFSSTLSALTLVVVSVQLEISLSAESNTFPYIGQCDDNHATLCPTHSKMGKL